MMKFCVYEVSTGQIVATGTSSRGGLADEVPVYEQWHEQLFAGTHAILWDVAADPMLHAVENGALIERPNPLALVAEKHRLLRQVDEQAENTRARFITLAPGQALVYEQKLREAERIIANTVFDVNGEPVTSVQSGEVPNLSVEASDLQTTLFSAAQAVVTAAHHWANLSSIIESKRLSAKRAINDASTSEEARAAANVDWNLP